MRKTVAFLAETPGSVTIQDQEACLGPEDVPIYAGRKTFIQLSLLLAHKGIRLGAGDRVKIYNLTCLSSATPMVIRAIAKLLKAGISFEICTPPLVIEPHGADGLHTLVDALDSHYRHIHGIKTHPPEMGRAGRKQLLDPEKLPEIRAKLSEPGATTTDVASALGVARSTLFNYLERYDLDRRIVRKKKAINSGPKDSRDQVEVARSDTDRTSA